MPQNIQQREELHKTIWAIANSLRGAIDGWEFKSYVLCSIFYRFISEILRPCYYEWMEFVKDAELIDCVEVMAIAVGNYPLYIDGNLSVSQEWKKMIMDKRHELKDYK